MDIEEKRMWGIHAQDDNLFLHDNVIAIGWSSMGDLSALESSRDAYKAKYIEAYPDTKKGSVASGAGMLYRFTHEVQIGDYVVSHQRATSNHIGIMRRIHIQSGFNRICSATQSEMD